MDAKLILTLILVSSIILPFGYYFITEKKRKKTFKAVMACNVFLFFGTLVVGTILLFSGSVTASAAEATTAAAASIFSTGEGLKYIAAALSTGMSTIGAGIAVASAASAALGALSEDSSIMGKALIFVALAEGVALYGMLISFMILNA